MHHRLRALALTTLAALLLAACPEEYEPPPVPPFLVSKAIFRPDRVWYVASTVVDAPFATGAVGFLGDTSPMEKIRWSIQESMLIGYRSYPLIRGSGGTEGLNDHTDPIVAYRILTHADLFQGQIVSAPRKSWAEKQYMVVDWSQNLVPSGAGAYSPVQYAITDPKDPHSPVVTDELISVYTKYSVVEQPTDPGQPYVSTLCKGDGEFMYCEPNEFTARLMIFPAPANDEFEPTPMSQQDFMRFPMFRKAFVYVDERFGNVDAGKRLFLDAYDIWKHSRGADGKPIPYRQREIAPVVWYLSEGAPDWFLEAARIAIDEWNAAFRDAVNGRRYWECLDAGGAEAACQQEKRPDLRVVKLCPHNPVQAGDDPDCGPAGFTATFGDLRYNQIRWVSPMVNYNWAAVGWFNVDHETARIVSSTVYLNAPANTQFVYRLARVLRVMNGDLPLDELTSGDDIAELINAQFDGSPFPLGTSQSGLAVATGGLQAPPLESRPPLTPEELSARLQRMDTRRVGDATLPPLDTSSYSAFLDSIERRAAAIAGGSALEASARVQRLWGTAFEDALIGPEQLGAVGMDPALAWSPEQRRTLASPLRPHAAARSAGPSWIFEPVRGSIYDPGYAAAAAAYKGWTLDAVAEDLLRRSMPALIEHELGHAFGIRHNFAASFDPFNYHPEYWRIRDDGAMGPRWQDPMTPTEVERGLLTYAYSSVMDYVASVLERSHGIGHHDKAAIKFAYGNLVEVLNDPKAIANGDLANQIQIWHARGYANGVFYKNGTSRGIHYTEYPALFGDLENRTDVPATHLVDGHGVGIPLALPDGRPAVPYRSCTDNDEGGYAACYREDRGADPYEIGMDRIQRYYSYYPETHFRQGRLAMDSYDMRALYLQFFNQLTATFVLNSGAVDDPAQLLSEPGIAASTLTLGEGFDFLAAVLTAPEPGQYDSMSRVAAPEPFYAWRGYSGTGAVTVVPGDGLYFSSLADKASSGYDYNLRIRRWGAALDKQQVIDMLTEAFVAVPNGDTAPDRREIVASFFEVYPDELTDLIGAALTEDYESLGPVVDPASKQLVRRRWATASQPWNAGGAQALDPSIPFGTRDYLRTVALTRLGSQKTSALVDSMRITVNGAGDDFTTTLPTVTFSDPSSGRTYRAISKQVSGAEKGIGARMLQRANALLQASTDSSLTQAERDEAARQLAGYTQEVERMRQLSVTFDQGS